MRGGTDFDNNLLISQIILFHDIRFSKIYVEASDTGCCRLHWWTDLICESLGVFPGLAAQLRQGTIARHRPPKWLMQRSERRHHLQRIRRRHHGRQFGRGHIQSIRSREVRSGQDG